MNAFSFLLARAYIKWRSWCKHIMVKRVHYKWKADIRTEVATFFFEEALL